MEEEEGETGRLLDEDKSSLALRHILSEGESGEKHE